MTILILTEVSSSNQIIIHFILQVSSLLPVFFLVSKYVTNTNYLAEKDVVLVPTHEAKVLHLDDTSSSVSDPEPATKHGMVVEEPKSGE